jgi:hypothetical protein
MSDLDVLLRIRSFGAGAPLARGKTLRIRKPTPQDLRLVFVRMSGESAPWGVAWALGKENPSVLTVTEARNRDDVAHMMERFAPVLLRHVGHPQYASAESERGTLWLAGPTHLEMLHHLAIAYQNVDRTSEPRRSMLRALGRASNWLFRESQRPGQLEVIDAVQALRDGFAFPADELHQQHLGFLLAWLGNGTREQRMFAAQKAERASIATTLDPVLERDILEPLVGKLREASQAEKARLGSRIEAVLERELLDRLGLLDKARTVIGQDLRNANPGLLNLVVEADRQIQRYLQMEVDLAAGKKPYVPNPLADYGPVAPARAMRWNEAYDRVARRALAHHDADLQAEWVAVGEAVAGTVREVTVERQGKKAIPVWIVESRGQRPLKLRPGSTVVVAGEEGRFGFIRAITQTNDRRLIEFEITGWKRGPIEPRESILPATDSRQAGRSIVLLEHGPDPVQMLIASKFGTRDGAGVWLTRKMAPKVVTSNEVNS